MLSFHHCLRHDWVENCINFLRTTKKHKKFDNYYHIEAQCKQKSNRAINSSKFFFLFPSWTIIFFYYFTKNFFIFYLVFSVFFWFNVVLIAAVDIWALCNFWLIIFHVFHSHDTFNSLNSEKTLLNPNTLRNESINSQQKIQTLATAIFNICIWIFSCCLHSQ